MESAATQVTQPAEPEVPEPYTEQAEDAVDFLQMLQPKVLQVAAALQRAQNKFDKLLKDTTNTFYKSKYATLDGVIAATRPHLHAEGLVVLQKIIRRDQEVGIVTRLLHLESGEELVSEVTAPPEKFTSQGVGSVITYLRRYDYQTIVGIAPEDDDGAAASGTTHTEPVQQRPPAPRPQTAQQGVENRAPVRAPSVVTTTVPAFPTTAQTTVSTPVEAARTHETTTSAPAGQPVPEVTAKTAYDGYIARALALAEQLGKAGLKAGRGAPVKSKLKNYILAATKVADTTQLTADQWEVIFTEFTKLLATPEGTAKAVELVEAASKEAK